MMKFIISSEINNHLSLRRLNPKPHKIESNMQALGRSDLPDFTMGDYSKTTKLEKKAVYTENKKPSIVPLDELTKMINTMEANHANQLSIM